MKYFGIATYLVVLILVSLVGRHHLLYAGECSLGKEYYIQVLEDKIDTGPAHSLHEAFYCLKCTGDLAGNRWAGPTTIEIFDRCKNSPLKHRIIAACLPYLELPVGTNDFRDLCRQALLVLSYYGPDEFEGYDVFRLLSSVKPSNNYWFREQCMAMAALGDPRTVDFIASKYDSIRTLDTETHTEDLIALLNCLYHIPGKEAVDLAKSIKSKESVDILVRRANRVVDRK